MSLQESMPFDLLEPIILLDDGILSNADYDLIAESESTPNQERDSLIAALIALAALLASQTIGTREFQFRAAIILRDLHWLKAKDFNDLPDQQLRRMIQFALKEQYYLGLEELTGTAFGLAWLVRDLLAGKNSLSQLQNRLRAFGGSDLTLENRFKREVARRQGLTYGIRQLAPTDHCPSCPIYASFPPLPIDELVMPTEACECRNNCKCSIIYMSLEEAIRRGASV